MSKIIYYAPREGDGGVRLDLGLCPWRHTINHQEEAELQPGKVQTTFCLSPDGHHLVRYCLEYIPWSDDPDDPWEERSHEVDEAEVRAAGVRIPDWLLLQYRRAGDPEGDGTGPLPDGQPLNLTPTRRWILEILAAAGGRMTKSQILDDMKRSDQNASEHTLRQELAKLVNAKWIDNDQKARPRGYAITERGRSILEGSGN